MKLKKLLASALCAAILVGLLPALPAVAADIPSAPFVDIADPAVAEAAELLRLFGVMAGDGAGHLRPGDYLTRAQFCRMAVDIRGEGDKAEALMGYTIFNDVKGDHWARGYINYASRVSIGDSGERLVMGVGDGSFLPDDTITFAQAVTMTLRLLGYSQKTVASGAAWYDGYLTTARSIGLLDGLDAGWDSPLTRGQAALLFGNLLFTAPLGGGQTFFTALGGSFTDEVILLSTNATTQDGETGALMVRAGETVSTYKTYPVDFPASYEGTRVKLMLDKDQRVMAMQGVTAGSTRVITLSAHEINYITTTGGERIFLAGSTPIYQGDGRTTYGAVYMDLKSGTQMTLAYTPTGSLEYIYLREAKEEAAQVAVRLTGVYQDASPSPKTPLTITFLNVKFEVLESAMDALAAFDLGDTVTLLFTADGKVVGAEPPSANRATVVGLVTEGSADHATVQPVIELKDATGAPVVFEGSVTSSAEKLEGQLVTVSSSRAGSLTLIRLAESGVKAKSVLDVKARTLDGEALADQVYLYERAGGGKLARIQWSQITVDTVPGSKISYAGTDVNGQINVLVLDDVTGDRYTYGFIRSRTATSVSSGGGLGMVSYDTYYIDITSGPGDPQSIRTLSSGAFRSTTPGGVAENVNGLVGATVTLQELRRVGRSAFDMEAMTVTVTGITYPISQDVLCYNETTKTWFARGAEGLAAARAYAQTMTLYYDKAPNHGGKIRMVVVK